MRNIALSCTLESLPRIYTSKIKCLFSEHGDDDEASSVNVNPNNNSLVRTTLECLNLARLAVS